MYIPDHRATSQSSPTNGEMSLVIPVAVVVGVGVVLVVVAVVIVICCKRKRPKLSRALRFVMRYIFYM